MNVNVAEIIADPAANCRDGVDEAALDELVASIRQHGLIHCLNTRLVDGRHHLVTGFRRLMACRILGWQTVEARVLEVTDEEARLINLGENLSRRDLNRLEEALALERIFPESEFSSRSEAVVSKLHRSHTWVIDRRRILKLKPEHQQLVATGKIPIGRVAEILASKFPDDVAKKIAGHRSVKQRRTSGKGVRNRRQIKNMIEDLRAVHLDDWARCLGWAVGQITTEELKITISKEIQCRPQPSPLTAGQLIQGLHVDRASSSPVAGIA